MLLFLDDSCLSRPSLWRDKHIAVLDVRRKHASLIANRSYTTSERPYLFSAVSPFDTPFLFWRRHCICPSCAGLSSPQGRTLTAQKTTTNLDLLIYMALQPAVMDMGNMLPRRRQRLEQGTEPALNDDMAQRPIKGMSHTFTVKSTLHLTGVFTCHWCSQNHAF